MPSDDNDEHRPTKVRRLIGKFKRETGLTRQSERLFHSGLIEVIRLAAANDARIQSFKLCHRATLFCGIDRGDLGWGCGYRNIQMLMSALQANLDLVFKVPSILELQQSIENAWAAGFDIEGAEQLSHKLLKMRKWIGTTEVYALMSYLGYDVELLQFEGPRAGDKVMRYCEEYFAQGPSQLPLYFQHSGHSRTIVGIMQQEETKLLVFDPALHIKDSVLSAAKDKTEKPSSTLLKPFIVRTDALKHSAFQLLRVVGKLAEADRETRKVVQATRY